MKSGAMWAGLAALAAIAIASSEGGAASGKKKRPGGSNPFSDANAAALKASYIAAVKNSGLPGAGPAGAALAQMSPAEIAALEVPIVGAPYAVASALIRKTTGQDTLAKIGNTVAGMPGSLFKF